MFDYVLNHAPVYFPVLIYVTATLFWGAFWVGAHAFRYGTEPANRRFPPRQFSSVWRASREGRDWMAQKLGIFSYIIFLLTLVFFGLYPGVGVFAIVVHTELAFMFFRFYRSLRRIKDPDEARLRAIWNERPANHHERKQQK